MKLKVSIGIAISIIFVYFAFRGVDVAEMIAALKSANYLWLIPALAAMLLSHWVRSMRWGYFLAPIKPVKTEPLFSALMIGYAANNVLPLRIGEFLRCFAVGKSQSLPISSVIATVIVERLIDILSMLTTFAVMILLFPLPDEIKQAGYVIFGITVSVILFIVLLMEKTEATTAFLAKVLPARVFSKVDKVLQSFVQGFIAFKRAQSHLRIFLASVVVWVLYAIVIYMSFISFAFVENYGVSFWASFVVLVMVSIGLAIPSSPGFVGTYHFFCKMSLGFYGVTESEALSFAIVSHAMNVIPFTLIGFIYFWKENLRISDAVAEKEHVKQDFAETEPGAGAVSDLKSKV